MRWIFAVFARLRRFPQTIIIYVLRKNPRTTGFAKTEPQLLESLLYKKSAPLQNRICLWTYIKSSRLRKSETMKNVTALGQTLLTVIDGDWDHGFVDGL